MYLKVDIDGEEQFFSFENQSAVTIGRAPESDIQLLTEGVSRNHLRVTEEGGDFFIEDLGSTNGTFLNDEKVAPGEKSPFNSFFPVKLGFHVYLYLVDEASAQAMREEILRKQQEEEEKKRRALKEQRLGKKKSTMADRVYVPSGKGANATGKTKLVKRKKIAVKSRNAAPQKKKSGNILFIFFALVVAGGAFLYLQWKKEFAEKQIPKTKMARLRPAKKTVQKPKGLSASSAKGVIGLDKCLGEVEVRLCTPFKKIRNSGFREGFLKLANKLYLIVDVQTVFSHYKQVEYSAEEKEKAMSLFASWMGRSFSSRSILENDYRIKETQLSSEMSLKSAGLIDILTANLAEQILSEKEIEQFYVVLFNSAKPAEGYVAHYEIKEAVLKELAGIADIEFLSKVYLRSGLEAPLAKKAGSVFEKIKIKGSLETL